MNDEMFSLDDFPSMHFAPSVIDILLDEDNDDSEPQGSDTCAFKR